MRSGGPLLHAPTGGDSHHKMVPKKTSSGRTCMYFLILVLFIAVGAYALYGTLYLSHNDSQPQGTLKRRSTREDVLKSDDGPAGSVDAPSEEARQARRAQHAARAREARDVLKNRVHARASADVGAGRVSGSSRRLYHTVKDRHTSHRINARRESRSRSRGGAGGSGGSGDGDEIRAPLLEGEGLSITEDQAPVLENNAPRIEEEGLPLDSAHAPEELYSRGHRHDGPVEEEGVRVVRHRAPELENRAPRHVPVEEEGLPLSGQRSPHLDSHAPVHTPVEVEGVLVTQQHEPLLENHAPVHTPVEEEGVHVVHHHEPHLESHAPVHTPVEEEGVHVAHQHEPHLESHAPVHTPVEVEGVHVTHQHEPHLESHAPVHTPVEEEGVHVVHQHEPHLDTHAPVHTPVEVEGVHVTHQHEPHLESHAPVHTPVEVEGLPIHQHVQAPAAAAKSLYDLGAVDIDGHERSLSEYRGKVALVVNVASACGFTDVNYKGLTKTYDKYKNNGFVILGFPCNQFGNQESGSEVDIKLFCTNKYNVDFPMFSKVDVNGPNTHPVFKFLRHHLPASEGGGGGETEGKDLTWNFNKFLVDMWGKPVKLFGSEYDIGAVETGIYHLLKERDVALAEEHKRKEEEEKKRNVHAPAHTITSLYDLGAVDIDGHERSLSEYRGKVALVVNVASACGFTDVNYKGLMQTYNKYKGSGFTVLGFPCNQFGNQESGTEVDIKLFCTNKYNVDFPMFSKVDVNGDNAHPVFKFLRHLLPASEGGGGGVGAGKDLNWNFNKFLVNQAGLPIKWYGSEYDIGKIEGDIYHLLAAAETVKPS